MRLHSAPTSIFSESPKEMLNTPSVQPTASALPSTASAQFLSSFENTWGQISPFPQSQELS